MRVCVCVYVCMCVCVYIYICMCIYIYTHTSSYTVPIFPPWYPSTTSPLFGFKPPPALRCSIPKAKGRSASSSSKGRALRAGCPTVRSRPWRPRGVEGGTWAPGAPGDGKSGGTWWNLGEKPDALLGGWIFLDPSVIQNVNHFFLFGMSWWASWDVEIPRYLPSSPSAAVMTAAEKNQGS